MKKFSFLMLLTALLVPFAIFAQQDLIDYANQLGGGDNLFGYDVNNKIKVDKISTDSISFISPAIKNEAKETITNYDILFSTYTIDQMIKDEKLLNSLKEKKINIQNTDTIFDFSINIKEDKLDPSAIYYLYVVPKDVADMPGNSSNEICFNLETMVWGSGDECIQKVESARKEAVHNAAGADMELANVSHTVDGNTIRITWTAIQGSDKLEFFLLNENNTNDNDTSRKKLGEADMLDQVFVFDYQGSHSTTLKIVPDNGGREKVYTLNFTPPVEEKQPEPKPEPKPIPKPSVPVVPQTGSKENFLIIFIIAVLGFVLYKAMKKTN